MKRLLRIFAVPDLSTLDRPIDKLKEIRDSYRAMNVDIYGQEIANLLNDC